MPFAYAAEQDGVIESIDPDSRMLKVKYKDGKTECVNFGEEYTTNASNGFFVNQEIEVNNFKQGDKLKKGDIVLYNKRFFTPDKFSKQVAWNIGVLANIALLDTDNTIEDSSMVCQSLCDELEFYPVAVKDITLTKDTNVHKFVKIGEFVRGTDPLIIFDQSATPEGMLNGADAELIAMLGDLNKATPKAEHTGEVVQIDVIYKCDVSELSSSLRELVKSVTVLKNKRAKFAQGSISEQKYQASNPITISDKMGTVDLTEETVVLKFYIKQKKSLRVGDKVFFDSSLKSVVSGVVPDDIATEDPNVKARGCTSARGILARIITSPFSVGIPTGILEAADQHALAIWDE